MLIEIFTPVSRGGRKARKREEEVKSRRQGGVTAPRPDGSWSLLTSIAGASVADLRDLCNAEHI